MNTVESMPASVKPIASGERIQAIDVLRGFALLGILPVNMIAFAHVQSAYENPAVAGGFTGVNYLSWLITHLIFENKMVTLFSMLFGVGLFIQVDRAEKKRGRVGSARGLYFRRVGWLLLFGLIHAYLYWYGDVLTYYALIGMLVYWLRRLSPRWLFTIGAILLLIGTLALVGSSVLIDMAVDYVKAHPERVEDVKDIEQMQAGFRPSPELIERESKQVRDAGFLGLARLRFWSTLSFQVQGFVAFVLWRFSGLMLFGIALYKMGLFSLQWSNRVYWRWVFIGFGVGIPLTILSVLEHQSLANIAQMLRMMGTYDYYASLFMAAGYIGIILLAMKNQWLPALTKRMAAVGQMAFTNYLTHTLICTAIFHGWGLAQFGLWPRYGLWFLAVTIWLMQLIVSPIWLKHFYFGPCEWVWRSLTYWKRQPMRRSNETTLMSA